MIPTNTQEEIKKAEFDIQRSIVSLIRELGKGNEKSRLHAVTLQALFSTLRGVQERIEKEIEEPKVSEPAKSAVGATSAAPKKKAK